MTALVRRAVLASGGAAAFAAAAAPVLRAGPAMAAESEALRYSGVLTQGGWIMLRADPGSAVSLEGGEPVITPRNGLAILGLDRDAPASAVVTLQTGGRTVRQSLAIAPVAYSIQRIDGLPMDQVEPSDPALLARIAAEGKRKQAALASRDPGEGFRTGFITPLARAVRTSAFGPQRILNGVPKTPHYGVDLAAPTGTPILAPADGLVVLAQPRMHFEGGLTLVDHGQGLVSMYLHQSRLDVSAGQRVKQGQTIGAVGATGRATGPHLCWRMTWRGRHMDPSLMIGARAPA